MNLYLQRAGDAAPKKVGMFTHPPAVDLTPNVTPGVPETRTYTVVPVIDDAEVGPRSAAATLLVPSARAGGGARKWLDKTAGGGKPWRSLLSMQPAVIQLENVSKSYALWSHPRARLQDSLYRRLSKFPLLPDTTRAQILGAAHAQRRDFFAVRDINLTIYAGQSVGILGRNGSGKSTLLQIIAGTLRPSAGRSVTRGRIVALLELGSGFNAEFTGRHNVHINASILGLSRRQIAERFEQIEAFADIGEFIDQPVKNYSSGMMLRLAFAVNVHLDPEILIIDEALSVGDAAFQRRCMARIETLKKNGGTLLFVSHSPESVVQLCDHAILLDRGEMLLQGTPKLVTSQYYKLIFAPAERQEEIRAGIRSADEAGEGAGADAAGEEEAAAEAREAARPRAFFLPEMVTKSLVPYASRGALIENPRLLDAGGRQVNMVVRGDRYVYTFDVAFSELCYRVQFGMMIKSLTGIELGGHGTGREDQLRPVVEPGRRMTIRFEFECYLLPGTYFLNAGVSSVFGEERGYLHRLIDAYLFRVQDEVDLHRSGFIDFGIRAEILDNLPPAG